MHQFRGVLIGIALSALAQAPTLPECYRLTRGEWSRPLGVNARYHGLPAVIRLDTMPALRGGWIVSPDIAFPFANHYPGTPRWTRQADSVEILWSNGYEVTTVRLGTGKNNGLSGTVTVRGDANEFGTDLPHASIIAHRVSCAELSGPFRDDLVAIYRAIARGDTSALRPYLADDLLWIVGATGDAIAKRQLLSAAAHAQTPAPRFDVDSVSSHPLGTTTAVEYIRSDHRRLGSEELVTRWRASAIFISRGNARQLVRHTLSWIAAPVIPITLDSTTLQAYVGRYQIAPGYVDDVHWENHGLVATASGQPAGARLVPVSGSAFSPDGLGALIVFERDAMGRVLGYVQGYPDGRVIRASRLP
jgi:hypothetical protein